MRHRPARIGLACLVAAAFATTGTDVSAEPPTPESLRQTVEGYQALFEESRPEVSYIRTDRPIYRPGDTIWLAAWNLSLEDFSLNGEDEAQHRVTLFGPRGTAIADKWAEGSGGRLVNDIDVPSSAAGGEHTLRVTFPDGREEDRRVFVSRYTTGSVLEEVEFAQSSYDPGDAVSAAATFRRASGDPLANATLNARVVIGGKLHEALEVKTDAEGRALIRFDLPEDMKGTDAVLNIVADDGGSRSAVVEEVPVAGKEVALGIFPEGGDLVAGLTSRVYVAATRPDGDPVEAFGLVVDDSGRIHGEVRTDLWGMGTFDLTPEAGRRYRIEVYGPPDVEESFALPDVQPTGCVMRAEADVDGASPTLDVDVACDVERTVYLIGSIREHLFAAEAAEAGPTPTRVTLEASDPDVAGLQGVARVTLVLDNYTPMAERLVYRNRGRALQVSVEADKERYGPREPVTLTVRTRTPDGDPVPATVAVSVVDQRVLDVADDESANILSRLYLRSALPQPVHEPNRYFDPDEERAAEAMDLLMGTRGYRRFEWVNQIYVDADGDRIPDVNDACPEEAEDRDGFEDDDGCFDDQDDDGDGVPQSRDACPEEKGTPEMMGCVEMPSDPDRDGIFAPDDLCPMAPEDVDGFEDEDGCPDVDNDRDNILDVDDKCPNEPEIYNGYQDEDGCPEQARVLINDDRRMRQPVGPDRGPGPMIDLAPRPGQRPQPAVRPRVPRRPPPAGGPQKVVVTTERIEIREYIFFSKGSHRIRPRSAPLLDEIAKVLNEYPGIRRVSIEGHTRDTGPERRNERLGLRRAEAVRDALVKRGVDVRRLSVKSWGEIQPIVMNNTERGRERNDRVDFRIIDMDGTWRAPPPKPVPARVFPAPPWAAAKGKAKAKAKAPKVRDDFRDTVFWTPSVQTNANGEATVRLSTSDALTTFAVEVEGLGGGLPGRGEGEVQSALPFSLRTRVPAELSGGDVLRLPITVANETDEAQTVTLSAEVSGPEGLFDVKQRPPERVKLAAGQRRTEHLVVEAGVGSGEGRVTLEASAGGLEDRLERPIAVVPRGFPHQVSASGVLVGGETLKLNLDVPPHTAGSLKGQLSFFPNIGASMVGALRGMVRMPHGCFEQTSSSNYPNVMVLRLLRRWGVADPEFTARAKEALSEGYRRLTSYEVEGGGFDWFGKAPAHEGLTAYGLLQFMDMSEVYPVSPALIRRTAAWLRSRRDGEGGYVNSKTGIHRMGRLSGETREAYIAYALSRTRRGNDTAELDLAASRAETTGDPYVLALSSLTLMSSPAHRVDGERAVRRLAELQSDDGAFRGAESSVVQSRGQTLDIEATALSLLALMEAGGHEGHLERGSAWLKLQRRSGTWSTTQATVLTLQALDRRAAMTGETRVGHMQPVVTARLDGASLGAHTLPYADLKPIVLDDVGRHMKVGANAFTFETTGKDQAPVSVEATMTVEQPPTSPQAPVSIEASLGDARVKLGETSRLSVAIENDEEGPVPMVLAIVGLPAGMVAARWQLEALVEEETVAAVETRGRELIIYLYGMGPKHRVEFGVDLEAQAPGTFTGPASRASLYYTPEHKHWAAPLEVEVVE